MTANAHYQQMQDEIAIPQEGGSTVYIAPVPTPIQQKQHVRYVKKKQNLNSRTIGLCIALVALVVLLLVWACWDSDDSDDDSSSEGTYPYYSPTGNTYDSNNNYGYGGGYEPEPEPEPEPESFPEGVPWN
eukprot:CAMPEP_0202695742 /NCGR_PEP_ID=MMETSP1385-20130828/9261_1 /ASSEMBLY_ACC=CAM_ASM_000861 /TAXON_ID=933848 /ORGANISM="Elphidium margaritaceum" /LENGTH=129 /DNA_ID=CAMNT_0049351819 /DNA_START=28 /DNA_END=417 /DNA_ORIENTATION=-